MPTPQQREAAGSRDRLREFGDWLVRRPTSIGAVFLLLTVVLGLSAARIETNETPYILRTSHPSRMWEAALAETFTNSGEQSFVVLIPPNGVFGERALAQIAELTDRLESLTLAEPGDEERVRALVEEGAPQAAVDAILSDGLEPWDTAELAELRDALAEAGSLTPETDRYLADLALRLAPVRDVTSLWNVDNIRAEGDLLSVAPLMRELPTSDAERETLRRNALENPLFRGALVSDGGTASGIQIEFAIEKDDAPNMKRAHLAVLAAIEAAGASDVAHLAGAPEVLFQTAEVMARDNDRFFPIVVAVIGLILLLGIRRLSGVFIPLFIAVSTVIWTLGSMQLLGIRLNNLTTALPVVLITIAVADAIHFLTHYRTLAPKVGRDAAIRETVRDLCRPIILTSVTTAIGFVAIGFTPLVNIREFGLLAATGVMFALLLTLGLLPLLIRATSKTSPAAVRERWTPTAAGSGARVLLSHRGLVLAASLGLFAVAGWMATDLEADATNVDAFEEGSPVRVDNEVINRHLGGTFPLDVWLAAEREGALAEPAAMEAIEAIREELVSHPQIGYAIGPSDYVARVHDTLTGSPYDSVGELPRDLIAQYLLLAEGGERIDLRDVLDGPRSNARIIALGRTDRGSVWDDVITRVEAKAKHVLPPGVELRFAGYGVIMKNVVSEVVQTQARSLVISAAIIATVMMLLFRSVRIGGMAVFPLVLTLTLNFAIMATLGVHLDVGTAIIASVVFGIGIDYSIHFIEGVRRQVERGVSSLDPAIEAAWQSVSRPIVLNSAAVGAGFLVLTSSGFLPLRALGALVASTLLLSALAGLLTLPVLLSRWGAPLLGEAAAREPARPRPPRASLAPVYGGPSSDGTEQPR